MGAYRESYRQDDLLSDEEKQQLVRQAPNGSGLQLVSWAEETLVREGILQGLLDPNGVYEVASYDETDGEFSFRLKEEYRG